MDNFYTSMQETGALPDKNFELQNTERDSASPILGKETHTEN